MKTKKKYNNFFELTDTHKRIVSHVFDLDCDNKTKLLLLNRAKKDIVKDEPALLQYIIVKLLTDYVKKHKKDAIL